MGEGISRLWHHYRKRVRSWWDLLVFFANWAWPLALTLIGTTIGVAAAVAEPPNSALVVALSVVSVMVAILLLGRDFRNTVRQIAHKKRVDRPLDAAWVRANLPSPGSVLHVGPNGALAYYDERLNGALDSMGARIHKASAAYSLERDGPAGAWGAAPRLLMHDVLHEGSHIFNDDKVRLASSLFTRPTGGALMVGPSAVKLQRTDYFCGRCTKEMAEEEVLEDSGPSAQTIYAPQQALSEAGQLMRLDNSRLSNHIGVSTLAFMEDGELVILQQSKLAAIGAKLLNPSGSGSADWDDVPPTGSPFADFLRRAMHRELLEETGLLGRREPVERAERRLKVNTTLLGYSRFVHRGGKPEFFGLTFIGGARISDVRTRGEEMLYQSGVNVFTLPRLFPDSDPAALQSLLEGLERFRETEGQRMSPSLQLNLLFLRHHVERRLGDETGAASPS